MSRITGASKLKLRILYRSNPHAPLWVVAEKSGIWEKNGLEVDTSPQLIREKAVEALKNGRVDLISGDHHNLHVRKAETLEILKNHISGILHLESEEETEDIYKAWARSQEQKPYPSLQAIANVFALAVRRNPEIADFNPLAMRDAHYVREMDDSGYIDRLYQ